MRFEPPVDRAGLLEWVRDAYDIEVHELRFEPVGLSSAACYVLSAVGGDRYFLKVWPHPRLGYPATARQRATLALTRALHERQIRVCVPYPVPTRDGDLWLADDGDRLKFYRNDSRRGNPKFTSVGRAIGLDQSGAWMGFAIGDIDGDRDLDVFVTNIGFHPLTRGLPTSPGGDCAYAHQFAWGTCLHYLLRNDGVREVLGYGIVPVLAEIAGSTRVTPSRLMPPESLDPSTIQPQWEVPTGLAAYEFGFGAVFFDLENDGDQDLYWLGSIVGPGEGPRGQMYSGPGRLLRKSGSVRIWVEPTGRALIDS